MAGEGVESDGVADQSSATRRLRRLRGRIFELVCAGATVFGISVVMGMILYVARDALRLGTAETEWYLVMGCTLLVPSLVLVWYYFSRNRAAGVVAYTSVGILTFGVLTSVALGILFEELVPPHEWLGMTLALALAVAAVYVHRFVRPEAALERLAVMVGAPILTFFGIPALSVDHTVATPLTGTELVTLRFSTPQLLPSVPDVVQAVPILPLGWIILVSTVTIPVAHVVGKLVVARREDGRGYLVTVLGTPVLAVVAVFAAPLVGFSFKTAVVLVTGLVVPTAVYLEGVVRRREGLSGLAFPVVLVGGALAGVVIAGSLGYAMPDPWLDWSFLTSSHSRTPEKAGIYPTLVGSVLIVLVIALSAFPVGVGAAIYLEEYAPSDGLPGRIVTLIEINIGNLAGVPSVVYGLLGLALFIQGIGLPSGIALVGGLTIGLLILPIVIISAQESIRAVPDSLREGSYAMGATRWQTVRNVVLPRALPGILTGTILALGRAIGETAPLLMIGIAASVRATPSGFFDRTGAMPRQIFSWASELAPAFRTGVMAAGVITLLAVLLVMNGTAIVLRNKYQNEN